MIISHKYRYLFIEIPLTGSWAIHKELCQFYGGSPVLHKHATYPEFQRIANEDERDYFVFATVRNPLDATVSGFFKLKTDHKGVFSDANASLESNKIDYFDVVAYNYLQSSEATFETTFMRPRIWRRPYSSMIDLCAGQLDFVLRFEKLNGDFAEVLSRLGITPERPLPVVNKTKGRDRDWSSYYTPAMISTAMKDYGPFMKKWGYQFPAKWGKCEVTRMKQLEYRIVILMKKIYLTHFRYSNSAFARFVRRTNVLLKRHVYT
jgi:hypothetical protein